MIVKNSSALPRFKTVIFTMICTAMLTLTVLSPSYAQSQAQSPFFTLLPDIPIMPGMDELIDESLVFDKPSGRYIKLVAMTDELQKGEILNFYTKALPALGWLPKSETSFHRGTDSLTIEIENTENTRIIYFTVEPL